MDPEGFSNTEPAINEIYEYAIIQYPGDRFVCQPFHRHALAVFRIRADRIKLDVALYDQKA